MKRGDLVRIGWTDSQPELYIVLEVGPVDDPGFKYSEPDDLFVVLLELNGGIYETIYHESEVRSGFFEVVQSSPT